MWSTGEGNGKPLQYSCLENPINSMKRQNERILKEELPRSVGAQYATGDEWRNNSRKNEGMEPKQKQYPAVDITGDRSKIRCCKEQYCIGTWNVRSMNQSKLEVVKQDIHFCFIDYAKAFDSVDHDKLWKILKEMGIPDHLTCLLKNLYAGQEATVRTGHRTDRKSVV